MSHPRSAPARADAGFYALLVGATFLMGSSFIAGKILLGHGVPAILLVGWRFLVASLATLPLLTMARVPLRAQLWPAAMAPRQAWTVALIGLLQTAAVMGLLFVGMRSIPAAAAAILLFSNPIWVALLGRLFLHESLGPARVAGLLLGMLGVALAIGPGALLTGQHDALFGELCCLASAVCWAIATTLNKRAALPIGGLALNFWQMLIGALVLLALPMRAESAGHPASAPASGCGSRGWRCRHLPDRSGCGLWRCVAAAPPTPAAGCSWRRCSRCCCRSRYCTRRCRRCNWPAVRLSVRACGW